LGDEEGKRFFPFSFSDLLCLNFFCGMICGNLVRIWWGFARGIWR